MAVLTRLLSTPVQLQVGEVLGVSKELSGLLNDSIKLKAGKPLVASSFVTRTRGVLIKLHMECDGVPITAIVDTGSQLNIVSKAMWKSAIKRPMDIAKSLAMNDANGGEGILRGLVQHVPLSCGNVVTEANLYVGEHVPFQLLLGRPWQRGNFVSIDERLEGTYLLFKDPKNLEVRYEIMVGIEAPDPTWSFDPTMFSVPANLLITVPEDNDTPPFQPELSQSRSIDRFPKWNLWTLIWNTLFVLGSIVAKIILILIWALVPVAENFTRRLEGIANTDKEPQAPKSINSGPGEFSSDQNLENLTPIFSYMDNPPTGRIANACIREDRSPIVPSTYTCSFRDRSDPEILDRVRSEISYHRRTGFNLQSIIGSHSSTELAPIFENGRLARRITMHDAVIITDGDNEDNPNVMFGDILVKFFPRTTVTEGPIHFPVWRSLELPTQPIGEIRLPFPISPDRQGEAPPLSLYVDVPDRSSSAQGSTSSTRASSNADTLSRVPNNSPTMPPLSRTHSPSASESSDLMYFASNPRPVSDRTPTPFPDYIPPISSSNSIVSTPQLAHSPPPIPNLSLAPLRAHIAQLNERLERMKANGLLRASTCDSASTMPPVSPSMPPLEPMVSDIEELPVTLDNRQSKRRRIAPRREPTRMEEDDSEDRLYSEDENSPVRIRPPSRRDVIFSDNPNMPSLSFHVSVPPSRIFKPNPFVRMRSPSQTLTEPDFNGSQSIFNVPASRDFFYSFIRDKLAPAVPNIPMGNKSFNPCDVQSVLVSNSLEDTSSTSSLSGSDDQILIYSAGGSSTDSDFEIVDPADDENSSEYSDMDLESEGSIASVTRTFLQNGTFGPPDFDSDELSSDELSSDGEHLVDDSERLPIMEDLYMREVSDLSVEEAIQSINENIDPMNYEEVLFAAETFLFTRSRMVDVSGCKTVQGRISDLGIGDNELPHEISSPSSHSSSLSPQPSETLVNEELITSEPIVPRPHEIDQRYGGSVEQFWDGAIPNATIYPTHRNQSTVCGHPNTHHLPYLQHLRSLRSRLVDTLDWVSRSLDRDDWKSVFDCSVNVLIEHGTVFRDLCINKADYFRETGSRTNAFLTETENHFLRSASGRFRYHGRQDLHDALIDILCVRTKDSDIVRQLLRAGYLDSESSEYAALEMLALLEKVLFEESI